MDQERVDTNQEMKRILVCVTGLSPQIVTETLFALSQRSEPWLPSEVHVLTTKTGADCASSLFKPKGKGPFHRLCSDYSLQGISFGESNVHVLQDENGRMLDDIRSQTDNLAMADAILAFIANLTKHPQTAVHVSLAGGRKSMGFFAGYALSLYGRAQDRLSHVLVSAGFETHRDFFFPPRKPVDLQLRSGEIVSTAKAEVDLADIPFVRLRDTLPAELKAGGHFVDAVEAAQRLEQPPELHLNYAERQITCGGVVVSLSPLNYAVYAWYANRAATMDDPAVSLAEFDAVGSPLREDLRAFGAQLFPNEMSAEAERWLDRPWSDDQVNHKQWLAERRARINDAIGRALGRHGKKRYGIASRQLAGRQTRHVLELQRQQIHVG